MPSPCDFTDAPYQQYRLYEPVLFIMPSNMTFGITPDRLYADVNELREKLATQDERHQREMAEQRTQHRAELEGLKSSFAAEITMLHSRIDEQCAQLKRQQTCIDEQNRTIAQLRSEVAEQARIIDEQNRTIALLRNEVAEQARIIDEQNRTIALLRNEVAEQDARLKHSQPK